MTAFALVGSRDERNYHLRALMAIAHIAQEEGFEDRWLSAPEAEGLRDICLLSDRKRDHDATAGVDLHTPSSVVYLDINHDDHRPHR